MSIEEHASHHPGRIPTPERVNEAHTQMPREQFNRPGGHRIYTQSGEEACYLCALLHEIDRLRGKLKQCSTELQEAANVVRPNFRSLAGIFETAAKVAAEQ